jgi:hypothetical protein
MNKALPIYRKKYMPIILKQIYYKIKPNLSQIFYETNIPKKQHKIKSESYTLRVAQQEAIASPKPVMFYA